jgi:hypothetical protein
MTPYVRYSRAIIEAMCCQPLTVDEGKNNFDVLYQDEVLRDEQDTSALADEECTFLPCENALQRK